VNRPAYSTIAAATGTPQRHAQQASMAAVKVLTTTVAILNAAVFVVGCNAGRKFRFDYDGQP
jgi:hypothetical protein